MIGTAMGSAIYSVCVFCGSRMGANAAYGAAAEALGQAIAAKGWRLVYGAGDVGLMGVVARSAQGAGAVTFGVIPEHLMGREVAKHDLRQLVVTENMHARKSVMFANSDAIIVLPGGAGSLDEFFEVLTWRHLGLHKKPILLLNTNGYWDKLTGLLDHIIAQGFADASLRQQFTTVADVGALLLALSANSDARQISHRQSAP